MRIVVFGILLLLLSVAMTAAAVELPCRQDSDCVLYTGKELACVQEVCQRAENLEGNAAAALRLHDTAVQWDLFALEEVPVEEPQCPQKGGCIAFAPARENTIISFLLWFVDATYSL